MYKATYNQLIEILKSAGCESAIAQLESHEILAETKIIEAIEIDYEIHDPGTENEYTHINEFNIFLKTNIVIFGVHTKHGDDFHTQWARTKPHPNPKELING